MPRTSAIWGARTAADTAGELGNQQGGAVSSRHTRSFFGVMLAVVFALSAVVVAPASAKLTKHQKAHIRKQLKRAIKKNPRLIRSKSFLKKAALSDFTLPVTIRLQQAQNQANAKDPNPANNPNSANLDL